MARYNKNGILDPTFGIGGKVIDSSGGVVNLLVQPDGKILANTGSGISRYNNDGSIDLSFGSKGTTMDSSSTAETITSFVLLPDGRILTAGNTIDLTQSAFRYASSYTLLRFFADGKLDRNFGTGGKILTLADSSCTANTSIVDSTGRFIVSGFAVHNPVVADFVNGIFSVRIPPVLKFLSVAYLKTLTLNSVDFSTSNPKSLVYPDPIIGTTTLEYTIDKEGPVSIDLLNMSGVCVQHFSLNEFQEVGNHKEKLTIASNISSGSYILRVTNPQGTANVKVIIQ
jgi:uncharacterized delta-60 repeat protein